MLFLLALGAMLVVLLTVAVALPDAAPQVAKQSTPTATPERTATPDSHTIYTPTRLIASKMRLDAAVMPVAATDQGAMATPKCASASDPVCGEVYWWSVGVAPGQIGNAVIAGHVNRPDASPASFGALNRLQVGDTVQIVTAQGARLSFTVTQVETVSAYVTGGNNPVINEIFGPSSQANLNLITCIGDWDGATFDHRLVIHTLLTGSAPLPQG
jgi:hypothetical protein